MKKILLLSGALAAMLLTACHKDPADQGRSGSATLRLNVAVERLLFDGGDNVTRSGDATRSTVVTQEGEDRIANLYLLFFEADDLGQGSFVEYVEVDLGEEYADMNLQTRMADLDLSGTGINPAAAYNILAVANLDDTYLSDNGGNPESWLATLAEMTEEEAISNMRARLSTSQKIVPNGLLMNGRIEKAAGQTQLNLNLTRNNARVDVVNNTREMYDLASATIWNAYPSSPVWFGDALMDYSSAAARIRSFYGVDNTSNESTVAGADGNGNLMNDIRGGLYVFENRVITPEKNDDLTTCLIIGLVKRGETKPTYYRANVVLNGKSQNLRHNHAYSLTIRSVSGPGAATEELAYLGEGNTIEYTIGWWNLDDNGLIVKDDYSILSIPTKVANISREANTSNFSIYTFSSLPSPAPLTIRSQTYTPADGGIKARLNGNTLVIEAEPLAADQTERRGVIILSFAGLETSLTVVQSGAADDFLRVYLPDGGIPRFLPYGGIPSGLIRVEASGPWTAQLYLDGFSFGSSPNTTPVTTLPSNSGLVAENRFRVYTNSSNESGSVRDAFIVVSLDKDPDNHQSLIRISQSSLGAIKLSPDDQTSVTFNGVGKLVVIPGQSNVNVFTVDPGMNDDGTEIKPWTARVIAQGVHSDPDYFEVDVNYHATEKSENTVTVTAKGVNAFGRMLSAVLRIETDPETYTDITLFQQPVDFKLTPSVVNPIPTTGGSTPVVSMDIPPSLKWSAVLKPVDASAADGRRLVHHQAKIVDQNGNPIKTDGTVYPATTQFRVEFPKVFYPNRDIPIAVNVEITVAGITKTLRVEQNTLTARPMVGFNMGLNADPSYGRFGYIFNAGFEGRTNGAHVGGTYGLMQIPGYSFKNPEIGPMTATSIADDITFLYLTPANDLDEQFNWTTINNYIDTRDAWTMFQPQSSSSYRPFNGINSPIKRNGAGYQNMLYSPAGTNSTTITSAYSNTKIYKFLMDRGNTALAPADIAEFYTDGVHTVIPGPWPKTAVVMMTRVNNSNYGMLIIDVKNKFMYLGESQVFWDDNRLTNNRGTFLDNLMYFIGNASKYGSHFTDLLLEDTETGAQPAPWDEYWGANRGGRDGGNGVGSK